MHPSLTRSTFETVIKFFLSGGVLYKRNYDSVLLRCVNKQEANRIMTSMKVPLGHMTLDITW